MWGNDWGIVWGGANDNSLGVMALSSTGSVPTVGVDVIYMLPTSGLASTGSVPHDNLAVTYNLPTPELTSLGTAKSASFSTYYSVPVSELTSTGSVSQANLVVTYHLPTPELASTGYVSQADADVTYVLATQALTAVGSVSLADVDVTYILPTPELFSIPTLTVNDAIYLGVCYATDNQSIVTYSNMPFIGSCVFNGKTLFINEHGLFEYGGLTDNGVPIRPSLKTGKMNQVVTQNGIVPTQSLKRIPTSKVYVSCQKSGGQLDLTVTADTNAYDYTSAVPHDDYATHAIKIGRGIKYNYIQLELKAHGCVALSIDSIRYDPVVLQRSER